MDQLLIRHLVPLINSTFSGFTKHLSKELKIDEGVVLEAISSYMPNSNISPAFKDLQNEIQAEMQLELDKKINLKSEEYNISMGKYNSDIFLIWGQDTRNIIELLKELGGRWKPVFCGKIYRVWQFNDMLKFDFVKKEIENKTSTNIRVDDRYYVPDQKCQTPMSSIYRNPCYGPVDDSVIKPSEIKKSLPLPTIKEKAVQPPQVNILKKAAVKKEIPETPVKKPPEQPIKLGKVQKCKDGTYYAIDHGFVFKNIGNDPKKIKAFCIGSKQDRNDTIINKITLDEVEKLDGWKIGYDQDMLEILEEEEDYPSSDEEQDESENEEEECSEGESDGEESD